MNREVMSVNDRVWHECDVVEWIARPHEHDDKYTRGILGIATGSEAFPGAAVLGVEAAARTGVGMIRYCGSRTPTDYVLRRRPEVVIGAGRVQAWLIGSGIPIQGRQESDTAALRNAVTSGVPVVMDAGSLDLVAELSAPAIITPHYRELVTALTAAGHPDAQVEDIRARPGVWAQRAAALLGVTVVLKGHTTYIAPPDGESILVRAETSWLATAGSGDVLGGILGALVATHEGAIRAQGHAALAALSATAAWLHARAGTVASDGGPIVALDIAEQLRFVLHTVLSHGAPTPIP